jgi:hemerythrin-like metal-binding protein
MPFFTWDPSYELGIEAIDDDHRRMFELVRRLHDGVAAGWSPPVVGASLRELQEQARAHFTREEDLLDAAGCPELLRQRGEHLSILEHLQGIEAAAPTPTVETVERLRDFLLDHVVRGDRGYATWLARAAPEVVADWARRRAAASRPGR